MCYKKCLGNAVETMLQRSGQGALTLGVFLSSFHSPNMGLQSASCGFFCVSQNVGQLSLNFLSWWDLVHSGAPSGLDV